jgi:hypothetical protein
LTVPTADVFRTFQPGPRYRVQSDIGFSCHGAAAMSAKKIGQALRDMGPLMLIALLVPGGMVIAWLIYVIRRRSRARP